MRNAYAGKCYMCEKSVGIGEGFFQRKGVPKKVKREPENINKKWFLRCTRCVGTGTLPERYKAKTTI